MIPSFLCQPASCDLECDAFFATVADVVAVAYQAVCEGVEEGCKGLMGYVSVAEPSNPVGDYIGGWIIGIDPYNPANSRAGQTQRIPRALMAVGLKLMETGWPQVGVPQANSVPSFESVIQAAYVSTGRMELITRALYSAVSSRAVGMGTGCAFIGMGQTRVVPPSGGLVGWTWQVQVEVNWN